MRYRIAVWIGIVISALSAQGTDFAASWSWLAPNSSMAAVSGDFNGSGRPSLAIVGTMDELWVYPNVNGALQAQTIYKLPSSSVPVHLATADVNGDGKLDLITANFGSNSVCVLLGNGDGSFQPAVSFVAGNAPHWVVASDVNGDGKLDLATANQGGADVSVLIGNGDGTFAAPVSHSIQNQPYSFPMSVAVGDVNGDSKPDLVAADAGGGGIAVMLNTGSGSFAAANSYYLATMSPQAIVLADVNGDHRLDAVIGNFSNANVSVLAGNGDGTFQSPVSYSTALRSQGITVADVNGDGALDIVAASFESNVVSILFGKGDGTFTTGNGYGTGGGPISVVAADYNGDGVPDIATANNSGSFTLLFANGDGSFRGAFAYPVPAGSQDAVAPDVNSDGFSDLIMLDPAESAALLFHGRSDGSLAPPSTIAIGAIANSLFLTSYYVPPPPYGYDPNPWVRYLFVAADTGLFGAAGTPDFAPMTSLDSGGAHDVIAADFDGDGTPDVAFTPAPGYQIVVQKSSYAGSLALGSPRTTVPVSFVPMQIEAADFNGDGKADIVAGAMTGDHIGVWLGNGDGTFQPETNFLAGALPRSLAIADFDGDGKPDVVVASSAGLLLLRGTGDGSFQAPANIGAANDYGKVISADFNNDGIPDIAATLLNFSYGAAANSVAVFFGNGDGTFTPLPWILQAGKEPSAIAAGDFNHDASTDLAIINAGSWQAGMSSVEVMLNTGGTRGQMDTSIEHGFYGDPVQWTLRLSQSVPTNAGVPSGTVKFVSSILAMVFPVNGTVLGDATVNDGTAVLNKVPDAGLYNVWFSYSGDWFYNPRTFGYVSVLIEPAPTSATIAANATRLKSGEMVRLTATVATASTAGTPGGSVEFLNGSTILGSASLAADGTATFSTTSLAPGTYAITAHYTGDNNHAAVYSSNNPSLEIAAPAYEVASDKKEAAVRAGGSAVFNLTVAVDAGFTSPVSFTCSGLPALSQCSFNPTTVTPAGSSVSTVLTITTTGPSAAVTQPFRSGRSPLYALWLVLLPPLLSVSGRSRRTARWVALALTAAILLVLVSCGGSNSQPVTRPQTPAGTSIVTVTASANTPTGAVTKTISLTLTVQ